MKFLQLIKYQQLFGMLFVVVSVVGAKAEARDLNAGYVLDSMSNAEQVAYVAGVIEGLAYARFRHDGNTEAGMRCIYDWYYRSETRRWPLIEAWFRRHEDKPVGALMHVLLKKECGE